MRMHLMLILLATSISLIGCKSMSGNVVPQTGPTMEQVYDGMGKSSNADIANIVITPGNQSTSSGEDDLVQVRKAANTIHQDTTTTTPKINNHAFQKIPNPELKLYIYPHLAGQSEIPIPGYYTAFNAYDKNHYLLPQEVVRN